MTSEEFFSNNEHQTGLGVLGLITPQKKINTSGTTTPNSKHGAFAKVQIDETPKNSFLSKNITNNLDYSNSPIETPLIPFRNFGSIIYKPLLESQYFRSSHQNQQSGNKHHYNYMINFEPQQSDTRDKSKHTFRENKGITECNIQQQYDSGSDEFFLKNSNNQRTKRTHQKGLKNLSIMVLNIVKNLGLTTYKDVTDKLIQQLVSEGVSGKNMKDQTNIKRRAYDILNVLVSSDQLQKVGKKIGPLRKYNPKTKIDEIKLLRMQIQIKKKDILKKQEQLIHIKQRIMDNRMFKQEIKEESLFSKQIFEFCSDIQKNKMKV